jgi:hypothetical protein
MITPFCAVADQQNSTVIPSVARNLPNDGIPPLRAAPVGMTRAARDKAVLRWPFSIGRLNNLFFIFFIFVVFLPSPKLRLRLAWGYEYRVLRTLPFSVDRLPFSVFH